MNKDRARLEEAQKVLDDKKHKDVLVMRRLWAYVHHHEAELEKTMQEVRPCRAAVLLCCRATPLCCAAVL